MRGIYRDVVIDPDGRCRHDSGWASNTIVRSAWPLLAGLLRGEERLGGLRYWAVGEGDPAWDVVPASASPEVEALRAEIDRVKVTAETIVYLDEHDQPSERATPRLEIGAVFNWPVAQTLREMALVGGEATEKLGTGNLVNYVIHRRIDLPAGSKLSRKLRLTLDPSTPAGSPAVPPHWLGREPIDIIDGVGPAYAFTLRGVRVETVAELARVEPAVLKVGVPRMKLVEMRARARLALAAAAALATAGAALRTLSVAQVLGTSPAKLAAQLDLPETEVARLAEQVAILQLTLDQGFLAGWNVGDLARSP